MTDIPTCLSKRETNLLKTISQDRKVIEIGSLFGYSTLQLAENALDVLSIDTHKGYPEPKAPSTYRRFLKNTEHVGNIKHIKDIFQNVVIPKADMSFIDCDGTFTTTFKALKATSHIPIVIVHDFSRQRCKGVEQAIKQFNLVQVVDSCAIIQNN
jgi:predicted rRNA methylase YqxC with S4 and FtsJ domains